MNDGDLPERLAQVADGRERARPVGECQFNDAGFLRENGKRLRSAENVGECRRGVGARLGHRAQDLPRAVGHVEAAPARNRLRRQGGAQNFVDPRFCGVLADAMDQILADGGGDQREVLMRLGKGLAPVLGDLHRRSDRDRREERDDEQRHRAAEQRLGFEQTLIGGASEGASKTAHGLRMQRCVGSVGARHRQPPRIIPDTLCPEGLPHLSESS